MAEMKDYRGPFDPHFKVEDLSREALIQLVRAGAKCYGGLNQYWYSGVAAKLGEAAAIEMQADVWMQRGASQAEVRNVCAAMGITGDDVAAYFKFFQCTPINATMMDMEFELKDNNHGILTITRCGPLLAWERNGDTAHQKHMCEVVEKEGFQIGALMFNPRMKTVPIQLPPRRHRRDIACQWEFFVE
jgi:hypothetical protein